MSNNIFSKLRDFVGLNEQVDYEYEYDETEGGAYQSVYPPQSEPLPTEPPRDDRNRLRDRALVPQPGTALGTTTDLGPKMNSSASNVIGLPGAVSGVSEVIVMEPRSFEEMPQAIQALRQRKSVVLNLTIMDPDQAQRAVDFIAGGTYALDGHQERIGESIFLFTPNCVQVSTQAGATADAVQAQLRAPRQPAPSISGANWSEQNRIAQ